MHTATDKLPKKRSNPARTAAILGILAAEAVAFSFLEGLLPSFLPVPGFKPGFSNIITMFAVSSLGFPYALFITLFKSAFALITRGATAAFLSLGGGLLSLLVMTVLFRFFKEKIGFIGIGVLSAFFHNLGQLLCAVVILGNTVLRLFAILSVFGIITGIITGTIFKYTIPVLQKQTAYLLKSTATK